MDSCRGARPSSTASSSEISAPLLPHAPPYPCPPVAAASTEADVLQSSPSAPSFAPLSRDSRPWRDQLFLIAFLAALAVLCVICLISALLESPGLSTTLVALSYARIVVAVVAAAPLVWGVLLYVRRRNSLTVVLPILLALAVLLFLLGAKVVTMCSVAAVEGKMTMMCQAWVLYFLWLLNNPLFLLLALWAVVVFAMFIFLLVAALVGHGLSAEEGDQRDEIRRGKRTVEAAVGGDAAAAAYPAIASAGSIAAVAAVPTHPGWPAHAPHLPAVTGNTYQPPLWRHLSLLGQALRFALTRSLGTAAAVALLIVVSYVLFIALYYWLAVYVFATWETRENPITSFMCSEHRPVNIPDRAVLPVYPTYPRFVVPVAAIMGKGVCASLAIALRLLPAHLLPSLALFVFARLLVVALATITQALLRLLAFGLTPSPLSASPTWVVAASFTRLFLSSILSTALSTLTLSLLAAVPAVYVYLALGERLDAHTGEVLGLQGKEKEEVEEGGSRVIEV
ncbi:unnamed protein product [Closterium sp. Yama58-4]|nr:unnamed protein product [Closterium sp. Yama58-4]